MKISVSRIKLFKACRRAYFFKYEKNLIPVETSDALQTGKNYHELIEGLYANGSVEEGYTKEHAMAKAYEKYIYPQFKVKSVEDWQSKEIFGGNEFIGRLDGIAEDGCVVEHKTTSADIAEEYEYNLQWDEQMIMYMWLTGVNDIYYTVCKKPTIRLKKNETEEEFYQRMVDWYAEDTENKIKVMKLHRTDEEIDSFMNELLEVAHEIVKVEGGELADGDFYKNTCHCNMWGRRCEYASICLNYQPDQEYVGFTKREG